MMDANRESGTACLSGSKCGICMQSCKAQPIPCWDFNAFLMYDLTPNIQQ